MIDIVEIFPATPLDIVLHPHAGFVLKGRVSVYNPSASIADFWKTTFGGGTEWNEAKLLIGNFWDQYGTEYIEKENYNDCVGEEESFYFDVTNQILYVHINHTLNPATKQTGNDIRYGLTFSTTDIYIDDFFYEGRIKDIFPYSLEIDPISIGKQKSLTGSISFANEDGYFDDKDIFYRAKIRAYKYSVEEGKIPTFYGNISDESLTTGTYTIEIKDARDDNDRQMKLDLWTTDYLEVDNRNIGKPIPVGFGQILGVGCVEQKNPTMNYRKFKGVAECLTVDAAYVEEDDEWTSVTVYNSSTDGSFELAEADCLNANGKVLPVKCDYTCDYASPGDLIVYLNLTYDGANFDASNYDFSTWNIESFALADVGILLVADTTIMTVVAEMQGKTNFPFFYWRDKEGKRRIKVDNPNRVVKYEIPSEDILNLERLIERDNDEFASSVQIDYSKDNSDETYLSFLNEEYRDDVFREYRRYADKTGDNALKSFLSNTTDAENASYIRMEDWQLVRDKINIQIPLIDYEDIEILDIVTVDLSVGVREYVGTKRCKVIGIQYIENDLINVDLRTVNYSTVVANIGGYMADLDLQSVSINSDDTLAGTEGTAYFVYNVDSSYHTLEFGSNLVVVPEGDFVKVVYVNSSWYFYQPPLKAALTVNLNSSMSSSEIQNIINGTPHQQCGNNIIFQFADGTYNVDPQYVEGFHGGAVYFYGNSSDTGVGTGKSVILRPSAADQVLFLSNNNQSEIHFRYIQLNSAYAYTASTSLFYGRGNKLIQFQDFVSQDTDFVTYGKFNFFDSDVRYETCGFANLENALIMNRCGKAYIQSDCSFGSGLTLDFSSFSGSSIHYGGNATADSINASVATGGIIFDTTGVFLP